MRHLLAEPQEIDAILQRELIARADCNTGLTGSQTANGLLEVLTMRVDDFDFILPEELIALRPAVPRHSARQLIVNGASISGQYC